jgi:hypothetical protein
MTNHPNRGKAAREAADAADRAIAGSELARLALVLIERLARLPSGYEHHSLADMAETDNVRAELRRLGLIA